jgi:hypothetical protein
VTTHHFRWPCQLTGPLTEFPLTINSMLDCGAHIILINPILVEKLSLRCFHLHKPIPVTTAIREEGGVTASHLYKYMKISAVSVDKCWNSNMVKAVIAPKLCIPFLLGNPFLKLNHIVMDFRESTAMDKRCNYDLLNRKQKLGN